MDIATAKLILEHPERAPDMASFVAAQGVIRDHWREAGVQLKPARLGKLTTDVAPRRSRRLMRLDLHQSRYRVTTDAEGATWLEEVEALVGAQSGDPPPDTDIRLEATGAREMGETMMGDRWRRTAAQRAANAAVGEKLNAKAREYWNRGGR